MDSSRRSAAPSVTSLDTGEHRTRGRVRAKVLSRPSACLVRDGWLPMDTRTFLGLESTHNRFRWKLPITAGICTPGNFMYGGAGLGAAIAALEGTSGRPTIWATAQYLTYARPGEVLDIDVTLAVEGHQMTQARACLLYTSPSPRDRTRSRMPSSA